MMSFDPSSRGNRVTRLPQPGSLEYINRPNPVEPSTLSHGSFDGRARELDRTTNEQLHPFLLSNRLRQRRDIAPEATRLARYPTHQSSGVSIAAVLNNGEESSPLREHTPHRRETDQTLFTLPKLPVRRGTKRQRVPPVLQGLHQPPPDAGILPSISTEDSQAFLSTSRSNKSAPNLNAGKEAFATVTTEDIVNAPAEASQNVPDKRSSQRNRWTDQETKDLLRGVAKFGIGSWKKILLCPDYHFHKRTAVDLKDRFRVCRPDAYGGNRKAKAKRLTTLDTPVVEPESIVDVAIEESDDVSQQPRNESSGETLWKARRRPRRNFTPEEDEALLKGFLDQGASWVSILKIPVFRENRRTPTDLRDRFRTRFPDKYAEAGLASRPPVAKPAARTQAARQEEGQPSTPAHVAQPTNAGGSNQSSERVEKTTARTSYPYSLPFPTMEDDSLSHFGMLEDDDDADPIILDRSIVDWANSTVRPPNRLPQITDNPAFPGIDPLVTLKLPKPGLF